MFVLNSDLEEPYVPFVTGRNDSGRVHEIRRRDFRIAGPRRAIGRVLVRAGRAVAGR